MRTKKAFTLIELLVVIAIIALLLSILMPALQKVKEQARRVICRTNLHQWSIAIESYAAANQGIQPSAFGYTNGDDVIDFVVPAEFWLEEKNLSGVAGQFSYESISPYMPSGFNPKGLTRTEISSLAPEDPEAQGLVLRGAWTCPSFKTSDQEVIRDMLWRIRAYGYMRLRYAYFGRSDLWPAGAATHPEDFGGKHPGSSHLLMTDIQYWYVSTNEGLDFNHSINPKKTQEQMLTGGVIPDIAGINKMYGDGSASWKDRREYEGPDADPTLLDISNAEGRRVRGGGPDSGAAYNACNWY